MKRFLLIVIGALSIAGCLPKKELPVEPAISLTAFTVNDNNKAEMTLHFTDGDGNFGLDDEDTSGVFAECIRKYNLFAEYYELQNGVWTHIVIDPCDEIPSQEEDMAFYNRVPWVKPTGQDQTQEGEIKVTMEDWYLPSDFDTIKFRVHVVDREMNESNTVEVGPLTKSQ